MTIDPDIEPFFPKTYGALVALENTVDRLVPEGAGACPQLSSPTPPQVHTPTGLQTHSPTPATAADEPPALKGA